MALNVDAFSESHLSDLSALTGEPLVTEVDVQSARAALAVAWENVKEAGSKAWTLDSAPSLAISVLISAAARAWMNLGGYTDERADAVTLARSDDFARGAELTQAEVEKLGRLLGKDKLVGTLRSTAVSALTTTDRNFDAGTPWYERNVMVYGPTINPSGAHAIPYLPGDEQLAAEGGNIMPFIQGHFGYARPFTNSSTFTGVRWW